MFTISSRESTVDVVTVAARLGSAGHVLVDVRTPEEVSAESIPGALNIPLAELDQKVSELTQYQTIDLICRSGGRSGMAAALLAARGLAQAKSVTGGLTAWAAAGLPIS